MNIRFKDQKKLNTKTSNYKMPKWMDCSWKRIPCGRETCKICGPISERRAKHLRHGENPDSPETVMQDIGQVMSQTLQLAKKNAKKLGVEIGKTKKFPRGSEPEDFPLVMQLNDWRDAVFSLVRQSYAMERGWVDSEAVADLTWYANILCSKSFRQNLNRIDLNKNDCLAIPDYEYTQSVLKTCLRILKRATSLVYVFDREHKDCWETLQNELLGLEKQILSI